MKRFLLRHASKGIFLVLGLAIGVPAGYVLAGERAGQTSARNPDMINISLPRDFFANLPKVESKDTRFLDVDTYTFATRPDDPLVLPRMGTPPRSEDPSVLPGMKAN